MSTYPYAQRGVTMNLSLISKNVAKKAYGSAYRARWGFTPPPSWSDWSSYEHMLRVIQRERIADVPGDVLEVGVLLGGGTYKLCQYFERVAPSKRVIAIDIFDPDFDLTPAGDGRTMAELYADALGGRGQREVFDEVTRDCANLTVLAADSAKVELPTDRIAFAYVDGNHSAAYVRSDFELVWSRLSPGGVIAFDDYGLDLTEVTYTLHDLIGEHAGEVERMWLGGEGKKIIFIQRRVEAGSVNASHLAWENNESKVRRAARFFSTSLR
jgi:hypothetical protein